MTSFLGLTCTPSQLRKWWWVLEHDRNYYHVLPSALILTEAWRSPFGIHLPASESHAHRPSMGSPFDTQSVVFHNQPKGAPIFTNNGFPFWHKTIACPEFNPGARITIRTHTKRSLPRKNSSMTGIITPIMRTEYFHQYFHHQCMPLLIPNRWYSTYYRINDQFFHQQWVPLLVQTHLVLFKDRISNSIIYSFNYCPPSQSLCNRIITIVLVKIAS